ncbi:diguanylate cyclase [Haloprofundus marisrubri]|uniref:Diguanylate cyclase n=1 Tax=Haloprofundus marisrubri TaxID=1514971 RepID=A0A0W1R7K7_9EURY|nr:VOC family protein [Haloprofundus marisrubri]KTG09591.1 diguanylate cyclase [Haloprofundus marisrubri]
MLSDTPGIHHVSAIVRDAQRNVDFYTDVLGLRFVKRTVDFEDRFAYHLYYGDERGTEGSVLTFFPFPEEVDGRVGRPQIATASLAIPDDAVNYWTTRFADHGVDYEVTERFDETVVAVSDPDGTNLELVTASGPSDPWSGGPIPTEHGIRGVHGVSLLSASPFVTASLLDTFGFELVAEEGDVVRYRADGRGSVVDILDREAPFGREGAGTIHHVAFGVPDEAALHEWRDLLADRDVRVSRVTDRHFFQSLYVRDAGGVLFELATEPVELVDDDPAPGRHLALPPQFEEDRETIQSQLPPLELPESVPE